MHGEISPTSLFCLHWHHLHWAETRYLRGEEMYVLALSKVSTTSKAEGANRVTTAISPTQLRPKRPHLLKAW